MWRSFEDIEDIDGFVFAIPLLSRHFDDQAGCFDFFDRVVGSLSAYIEPFCDIVRSEVRKLE
ncbi:hypothetical protein [Halorubrum sp. FL23]|uniref:hypothetical protein n=1 Tax=Halorubrum sp. FL23 TaxID=3458704 RepID=UPI0040345D0C